MTDLRLDWSTAEVHDGKLKVSLDDRPTPEWRASFERTEQLLNHGSWPDVKLKKGEVVAGVEPGSEEKLRFFLESVVQEANAEQGTDEAEESTEEAEEEDDDEASQEETDPDREMTERFRSFAPEG